MNIGGGLKESKREKDSSPMQTVDQSFEDDEAHKHSPRHWVKISPISFVLKHHLEVENVGPSCTAHARSERKSLNGIYIL